MSVPKGRNTRVEVAATYATAKVVSAITNASPGVATSTAHGLANGTIGYFSGVEGMVELEDQAASVDNTATNAFDIEGLATTNFGVFSGSADFTPVATWLTLSNSTGYTIGGGNADELDATTLLDTSKKTEFGMNAADTVTIDGFSDSQLAGRAIVQAAARAGTDVVFRFTLSNGERRVFRGQPSLPGEAMSVNQKATGSFNVAVKGQVMYLPA
jgi:Phage tail tube protein, TTP